MPATLHLHPLSATTRIHHVLGRSPVLLQRVQYIRLLQSRKFAFSPTPVPDKYPASLVHLKIERADDACVFVCISFAIVLLWM
ncbi:hypothetical protein [Nostoc sp. MG11]|uniref:hypothetical protein n=1 Tax=Nostoc sp. MG11 TaxID=2721166 RepID=UPI0029FF26AA|nr:hypothetical protein [Nostoc sp. MG11]